ncbi:GTP-binding protein [Phycicoccus avicenniae]|uniref:GTP-binding protein n=1 Tax=Phycicoccus avicenniae TaxID=2828860 RepID=UPI003D292729
MGKRRGATGGRLQAVVGAVAQDRVVFCGPLGVGKTTAVRAISDVEVANTDVRQANSRHGGESRSDKTTTTVGIDYGEWQEGASSNVAVYGTPGQVRFDTVRTSTMSFSVHVVLWLFGQNEYALEEAEEWLRYLGVQDASVYANLTVAVSRLDEPGPHPDLDAYRPLLDSFGPGIRLMAADPRDKVDVQRVVALALGREVPVPQGVPA